MKSFESTNKKKTIGVILAYNVAPMLPGLHKRIPHQHLDDLILVDDASTDETIKVSQMLGIRSFSHSHLGYGGNLKFGIKKALELGADHIIEIHGDGQYDPSPISEAIKHLADGSGLVLGSRFLDPGQAKKDGMSPMRYYGNKILSSMDRIILKLPLTEFYVGFRGYNKQFLETINYHKNSDDYFFSFEIITQAHYRKFPIKEIPVRCNYNDLHTSANLWKLIICAIHTKYTLLLYLLAKIGIKLGAFADSRYK